ncbi:MAG: hypothetical protein GXY85_00225 [Candidatus Brocadiaceae bacterium]|nr:hypothetical protein [Candidatus Brocadiaceae bacterium]
MSAWRTIVYMAVLAAVAHGGSICAAQEQGLRPLSDGRIQRGPYLLFGDPLGGLGVMRGSEITVMGAGVFCGFTGKSGYWPYDRMPEKALDYGDGTIGFRGAIPQAGVSYHQQVSIEGERVRIRIRREGTWNDRHWESFFVRLPFNNYLGARVRADGRTIDLPRTYSREGEVIVAGARRLECHVADPSLNLVFECERGIRLADRRGISDPCYLLSVEIPEASGQPVDVYVTLPDLPDEAGYAVRYSPIGYPVRGEKTVVLEWPNHLERPADDRVRIQRADGAVVREGRFGRTVTYRHMQASFAPFDFTDVREPGDYRALWAGGEVRFSLRESIFQDALWEPTLDCFIPFQMCHAHVDLGPGIVGHAHCHMDDGIRVPAHYAGTDGFVGYECTGTPYEAGDPIPCGVGGWHDAGDCDLNIYAQGYATYLLALAYEEFGLDRDVSTLDVSTRTFQAGRPDGTPDVLQQVEWGALWLLSMLQEDGRSYVGVVVQANLRRNDVPWNEMTDNRPGTGDERHVYVDYHADLQCMQAAALSAAARALREARPELARRCVEGARRAYEHFGSRQEVYRKTAYFYPNTKGRDGNVLTALGELYMTTADPAYLRQLEAMTETIEALDLDYPSKQESTSSSYWYAPPVLARLARRLPEGRLRSACVSTCRRAARFHAERLGGRPWAGHYTDFGKVGNTAAPHRRAFDVYWLSQVAGDVVSMGQAVQPMLWTYGFHPFSNVSFVSGIGPDSPKSIFSLHLRAVLKPLLGTVPGAPVPGMTAIRPYFPDGVLYYFDEGNVPNGESTIAETAAYVFAVNAMGKAGF